MCVIALKYIKDIGWIGGKNRDRNYEPTINIKQSFKHDIERILMWDEKTKWTEGVNENGVSILNATVMVCKDEKEGDKAKKSSSSTFYSPSGKSIRTALFEKNPKSAMMKLIELETEGNSIIYDKDVAYLLEATVDDGAYIHKYIKCDKDIGYVRTNHGHLLPNTGYPKNTDDEYMRKSRISSEKRFEVVNNGIDDVESIDDLFKLLSNRNNKNPQHNPVRISDKHGKRILCTTGQIVIVPDHNTLYYRPIWCKTKFNFDHVNRMESKTFFEIISSRKLFNPDVIKESEPKMVTFGEFIKRNLKSGIV